ncbi:MAG: AAA family ATPase [Bacteroidales bacterium]|nr:AAA family ATPase [Bacteroidales bacterium]
MDVTKYLRAGYPIILIETMEVKRAVQSIITSPFTINNNGEQVEINPKLYKWNIYDGIYGEENFPDIQEPLGAIQKAVEDFNISVLVLENFDYFIQPENELAFPISQRILNDFQKLKSNNVLLCIVGTDHKCLSCLDKVITVLDFDLPKKEEFRQKAKEMAEERSIDYKEDTADACSGLGLEEGENALALSIIENDGVMDKSTVMRMKREMIRKTGFMDFMQPEPLENIGGLENAIEYINLRKMAWSTPGFPKLNSVFLIGVTGCGKTLFSKVLSSIFDFQLILWDVNGCKGSLVGETEKNMRVSTKTIDAFGPCIILVD